MFSSIHLDHVIIATLMATAIGTLYFHRNLFDGKVSTPSRHVIPLLEHHLRNGAPKRIALLLVFCLINALVLDWIFGSIGSVHILEGLLLALAAWAGFGLTFSSWPVIFAHQSVRTWISQNGAYLIMQMAMAAVLVLWR